MTKLYFRFWNKYTNEMIYLNEIGGSVDLDTDGTYSVNWYDDLGKLHTLDDAILMQGLEINSVVIYEGDIIEYVDYDEPERYLITKAPWGFAQVELDGVLLDESLYSLRDKALKVVGNIYENKELIGDD